MRCLCVCLVKGRYVRSECMCVFLCAWFAPRPPQRMIPGCWSITRGVKPLPSPIPLTGSTRRTRSITSRSTSVVFARRYMLWMSWVSKRWAKMKKRRQRAGNGKSGFGLDDFHFVHDEVYILAMPEPFRRFTWKQDECRSGTYVYSDDHTIGTILLFNYIIYFKKNVFIKYNVLIFQSQNPFFVIE